MKPRNSLFSRSSFWTLAVGVAIGGASMANFHIPLGLSNAFAAPAGNSRLAGSIAPGDMSMLRSLDNSLATLAQAVEPSVVNIKVSSNPKPGSMTQMGGGGMSGEGSGVIFRPDGYIITNDHVVAGMDKVTVVLTDGREFEGKVIRSDDAGDIAVVKINATDLPAIPFADSNKLRTGQMTMAVGSPFGLSNSVTIGHVSATDREQMIQDPHLPGGARAYPDLIQTDASINPGNSGGALVNIDGEVIGVNTMIATASGSSSGVGFAIPSNQARLIAEMLIQKGTVKRSFLGLIPEPLKEIQKQQLGVTQGAYVESVPNGTPAANAGIQVGDVITKIGSNPITNHMDVRNSMFKYNPGDSVKVEVVRDGKHQTFNVKLSGVPPTPQMQNSGQQQDPFGGQNPFGNGNPFRGFRLPSPGQQRGQSQGESAPRDHSGAAHLGASVAPLTDEVRAQFHVPADATGVVVAGVEPGSVAETVGLQPGDVITDFNGAKVTTPEALISAIKATKWGDHRSISFQRWNGDSRIRQNLEFDFK